MAAPTRDFHRVALAPPWLSRVVMASSFGGFQQGPTAPATGSLLLASFFCAASEAGEHGRLHRITHPSSEPEDSSS